VDLLFDALPETANIEITTEGGWPEEASVSIYPIKPALVPKKATNQPENKELPETLKKPYGVLSAMERSLANVSGAESERAFLDVAIKSIENYRQRSVMDPGPGYYRPITPEREEGINQFYERTALTMYHGFVKRMERYAAKGDGRQRKIATLFSTAQK